MTGIRFLTDDKGHQALRREAENESIQKSCQMAPRVFKSICTTTGINGALGWVIGAWL
jgi:hypothetical protein